MKLNSHLTLLGVMSVMLLLTGTYLWQLVQSGDGSFTDNESAVLLAFSVTTVLVAIGFGFEAVRRSLR
jgi:hypothetical protein